MYIHQQSVKHNCKSNHCTLAMRTSLISYKSTVLKIYLGTEAAKKLKCVKPLPKEKRPTSAFIPSKVAGRTEIHHRKE